ncbi:PREDICTED: UNC93-like protein [Nicrophorus vespilloides]|uniref:UNC93-like protein n=1 Tax=Nicrophorus vespilloides TaxID=110193 RepID=A0ABM1NIU1_NICVS|nr:PREDICTED: UNC93-like protein [Nicrophorus vespilloides]
MLSKMGSLPNLHELGKAEAAIDHVKIGPAVSNPHQHSTLTQDERNKILHRHSTHCKAKYKERTSKIIYDDFMLEQMATYSPICNRSTRNLTHTIRRRDSMNSSIGANSVRRLIGVVRNTNSRLGPVYSRKVLIRNVILICVSHVLITATFLPFLALQGSVSVWTQPIPNSAIPVTINLGSILLTIMHVAAAVSSILAPSLIQKWTTNVIFVVAYSMLSLFHAAHFHPLPYIIIPVYLLYGLCLGPLSVARVSFLMTISTKLNYMYGEEDEETKIIRRTCIIRRVARGFQAAHDFGLIFGSILTAALITITINLNTQTMQLQIATNTTSNSTDCSDQSTCDANTTSMNFYEYNSFLDDIFDVDEMGDRLCGAQACPSSYQLRGEFKVLPEVTTVALVGLYVGICLVSIVIVVFFVDKIKLYVYQDPLERSPGFAAFRGVKESFKDSRLQMAAPLAFFIGLEQAFMYADFSKSYVVCTLGIHRLNLVFLCMGLLQSIAACTLSMLLRSIRRYYVIAVGFTFHACLMMVQMLWKPIGDDPALFYVISAAWGVCNAVWEMMNFTLLTGLFPDNWEPAFANSFFFRFLGLGIAFGSHGLICNWLKLYFLGSAMLVAVVPFAWLEMRLENMRRVKNVSRL